MASVTDFMPVGRRPKAPTHDYVRLNTPHCVVRLVEGLGGRMALKAKLKLSSGFGRRDGSPNIQAGLVSIAGCCVHHDTPKFSLGDGLAEARFELQAGQRRVFLLGSHPQTGAAVLPRVDEALRATTAFWQEWAAYCRYRGPYCEAVMRSALVLKLLTYAPSGAIIAALTTSLPAQIGGTRKWDYRYCWLRDSAFTLYALAVLGYGGEARCFGNFLQRMLMQSHGELQTLYGVDGETALHETAHPELEGYRKSRPVRIGNAAFDQYQADI